MKLKTQQINLFQKIGWLILRPIFKFFTDYKLESESNIKNLTRPMIIVSNHVSFLDPLIIGTILPINSKVYPLYFITKDTIITTPLFGGFLKLFGAFRAWKGKGLEKSLEEPKKILQAGYSVVFFPQGHRYQEFKIEQGRPGTAALALATNKPILPIAICGLNPFSWKKFFLRKYKVKVKIGQPFWLKEEIIPAILTDLHHPTQIIMEKIEKLLK